MKKFQSEIIAVILSIVLIIAGFSLGYKTDFHLFIILGFLIILLQVRSIFKKLFPSSKKNEKIEPFWRKKHR